MRSTTHREALETLLLHSKGPLVDFRLAAMALEDVAVLAFGDMKDGRRYAVRLRGRLDIEALPTPVRLLAYVSSAWDMDSDWYKWRLAR